jgi:hypothetical protein
VLRIQADRPGQGELFWTGTAEGPYGGFLQEKTTRFEVAGGDEMQEVGIFPFWQTEGAIRKLRLDLYEGATFRIASIRIVDAATETAPIMAETAWDFRDGAPAPWAAYGADRQNWWALPLAIDTAPVGWVALRVRATEESAAEVRWATRGARGYEAVQVPLRPGEDAEWHNVEAQGSPRWKGELVGLGVRLPAGARLEEVRLAEEPMGPPRMTVRHFGPENGANRAGRACNVLAQVENTGGGLGGVQDLILDTGEALRVLDGPHPATVGGLAHGETAAVRWTVAGDAPGTWPLSLRADAGGAPVGAESALRLLTAVESAPADYVPTPRPVETDIDVCAYYFPGWGRASAWEPIRQVAPIRKPVLGYYDERLPEVVDWQIKWSVENGVTCYLVDWYWVAGSQHLTHWFEAYRRARYRDLLQVAIMWANHNPPGTHSHDDWRAVTREWIDRYFNLPRYYHVAGMPAVFLWSPQNLREDLGGSEAVRRALDLSQEMAREAGYAGIAFLAMFDHDTPSQSQRLLDEGFYGCTNYHEWGDAMALSDMPNLHRFEDVVATAPKAWERRDTDTGSLMYYPLVDTGWDSRPWHGAKARVFTGRTPEGFENLLRAARSFAEEREKPFVVLGPLNEWGEGSYIEPNTEFDFDMLEAVRGVFAKGAPDSWPVNIAPADVGLGSYDFPEEPHATAWDFEDGDGGWSPMMNAADWSVRDGVAAFTTAGGDAALRGPVVRIAARDHPVLEVRMRLTGHPGGADSMQLFWGASGGTESEASSVRVPLNTDGAWHTYRANLRENPRWRGTIASVRFDPCGRGGVRVELDRIAFVAEDAPDS